MHNTKTSSIRRHPTNPTKKDFRKDAGRMPIGSHEERMPEGFPEGFPEGCRKDATRIPMNHEPLIIGQVYQLIDLY